MRDVPKVRVTFQCPPDLVEQLRDAVVALSGPPEQMTLARLAEDALRSELRRLERRHNRGAPFPKRRSPLRVGRPIS